MKTKLHKMEELLEALKEAKGFMSMHDWYRGRCSKYEKLIKKYESEVLDTPHVAEGLSEEEINKLANDFVASRFENLDNEIWADEIKFEHRLFTEGAKAVLNAR